MLSRRIEIWLAIFFAVLAGLTAFVWAPLDSETAAIYEFRRQISIGDAMLPMVAGGGILLFSVAHLFLQLRRRRDADEDPLFDRTTLFFFVTFGGVLALSLILMFWAGPLALALFGPSGDDAATYRQMRSSLPWKYIGFVLGGFTLVFGLTSLIEGRVRWLRAVSSILAVLGLILIFDVPFDTILLPPNGDF
ncbi:hypothetical protein DDE20_16745 [Pararhodobacter oceanensis]|uniref:Tripartite tricarboxylate transporter TctB family protein n=2 Tax=Pararhodobacter oceanensis TaxID=2172121 RepID=A0A2T8HQA1_9RHOB|nr:hypothetical protein DDE20_16745 [Pararhodobacter oceanensis]